MKSYPFFLLLLFFFSCVNEKAATPVIPKESYQKKVTPAFQTILDSSDVHGAILILDPVARQYHSNDFDWCEKGQLPASTFKIPNSIIAFETGVVAHDSVLFAWDGTQRALKIWEQDLLFRDAFKFSCVPCYQEVARKTGVTRMNQFLDTLDYGNIIVDSTNLDLFWLTGTATITPFQQIDFLKRFYQSELPIMDRTKKMVRDMMVLDEKTSYTLFGKTGWSVDQGKNNGWFVGFVETNGKVWYFATNVEPNASFEMELFGSIRKEVVYRALQAMKII